MNNPMETNSREVDMSVQVADHQNINVLKWFSCIVFLVAGLATVSVVLEPVVRYSYIKNDTFGLGVRTDLLTREKCLYIGSDDLARKIGLRTCE